MAVDSARSRMGRPVEMTGVAGWVLTAFMALTLSVAIAFLCLARYAKTETLLGEVTPSAGVARIFAPKSGVVRALLARSGDQVRPGQPLFLLSYDTVLESGARLGGRMDAVSREQLEASRLQGLARSGQASAAIVELDAKVASLIEAVAAYRAQRQIQLDRIVLLEKTVSASQALAAQNLMSSVVLRQREDSLLSARQGLSDIDHSIAEATSQIVQGKAQRGSLILSRQEAQAGLDLAQAQLMEKRLENQAAEGVRIVAAKGGRLTNVQVRAGDAVEAGSPLALVAPDTASELEVTLWAPSRAIGFVKPGDRVRLMFDAFPFQTFGAAWARVSEISRAPIMPNDLPVPIETKEQMYKVTARLERSSLRAYGKDWPLAPGMRLTGDLVLSEKSLLEWLFDPIMATRERMAL